MPVDLDAPVLSNHRLSPDYCVLAFRAPELGEAIRPGQFVMIRTGPGGTPLLRRPYSVFERIRDADGRIMGFSILNKRVGIGSALLYEASVGQRFSCLGPLGRPFTLVVPPSAAWMVAGGTGLAPFATLAEDLAAMGTSLTLFYGARTADDLFCLDLFEPLGVRLILATEDGSRGEAGRVTVPLARDLSALPRTASAAIYACGPGAMLKAVAGLAAANGRACELAIERQMGCGMGGCYSCVVRLRTPDGGTRYARSCIEGPVFPGDELIWEEEG
ncbi:MAG TPA: dihydroorotate dehydrogenase electron transfer subunit [Vicinamibacterales bacterium]|jgi:dihydroorotate dehydrogenase electron transfer subunit